MSGALRDRSSVGPTCASARRAWSDARMRRVKRTFRRVSPRRANVVRLGRLARDHERVACERADVLGVKPSDLEWPLSSDSEAPAFPASVMSPLTTAGSPSWILACGLPGVVACCSGLAGAAELNLEWDLDPSPPACSPTRRSEATRMRLKKATEAVASISLGATHRRWPSRAGAGTRSQSSSSRAARRSGSARCGGSKWWRSSNVSSA
jgi:hypothetical protein